jgi:hypothetical protein
MKNTVQVSDPVASPNPLIELSLVVAMVARRPDSIPRLAMEAIKEKLQPRSPDTSRPNAANLQRTLRKNKDACSRPIRPGMKERKENNKINPARCVAGQSAQRYLLTPQHLGLRGGRAREQGSFHRPVNLEERPDKCCDDSQATREAAVEQGAEHADEKGNLRLVC